MRPCFLSSAVLGYCLQTITKSHYKQYDIACFYFELFNVLSNSFHLISQQKFVLDLDICNISRNISRFEIAVSLL